MKLLIIDIRLVFYQTYHRKESFLKGIQYIYDYSKKYKPFSKIIFAYDSKLGSKRRKKLYKDYKAHRNQNLSVSEKKKLDEFNKKYEKLLNILPYLGTLIHLDGYEADDIANIIVDKFADKYEVYLLSSDKDWSSNLINENIKQIHLTRGLITKNTCKKEFGLIPENILQAQMLAGVRKENIKGINKLGDKRIKHLLNNYSLQEIKNILQEWVNSKKYGMSLPENFNNVEEMYQFNYELLRKVTFDDLSDYEKELFKKQFNTKQKEITADELEIKILETYNEPFIFSYELKNFYRLK